MAIITISKEYGSESEIFAEKLAKKLGYEVLDRQFIKQCLSPGDDPFTKPHKKLRLFKLIDDSVTRALKDSEDYSRSTNVNYFRAIKELIEKAAVQDNVIIVGFGGQCILSNHPKAIHIRIVKSIEERIAILKQRFGLDDKKARELIAKEESESSKYIEKHFNRLWDDPHLYHLVLNLSKINFETAVDIVENLVKSIE